MESTGAKSKVIHPGVVLSEKLAEINISQREMASMLGIPHSHLNDILNGKKNINPSIAMSLEAAKLGNAIFWLTLQMNYQLEQLKTNSEVIQKTRSIEDWNSYMEYIPVRYFKNQGVLSDDIAQNISIINSLYNVNSFDTLKKRVLEFDPIRYRKSSAFKEELRNILGWEVLAAAKAKELRIKGIFDPASKDSLVSELNSIFKKNIKTLDNTTKVLSKYGIRFITLDRPTQTPVDGKTFKIDDSPAICLTLKYKRLDNFAYTLMHELGHVFLHLANGDKYKHGFYAEDKSINPIKEEAEADQFAAINLIPENEWDKFNYHSDFSDESIIRFSKKINVHPAIIRGRVCYLHNEYYQKRTKINAMNVRS